MHRALLPPRRSTFLYLSLRLSIPRPSTSATVPLSRIPPCSPVITQTRRHYRSPREWPPEVDAEIMHLHNQGFNWTQISEAVGVPYSSCYKRYCTFLDPNLESFWTKKRLDQLEKMALEGRPWKDIAHHLQAGQDKPVSTIACQHKWDKICRSYKSDMYLSPNNLATLRREIEMYQSTNRRLDWDEIAGVLDNKFTGRQLKFKYSLITRGASRWRKSQDMDLIRNVMLAISKATDQTNKQDVIDWVRIANQLGQHTPQECETRWQKMRARLVQKREISPSGNFWSEKEIEAYWKAWTAFGNDWVKVAESIARALRSEKPETQQDNGRGLILPLKTAQDCQADFDHLVRESNLRSDMLKPALGDFVDTFSMQPRRRVKWTIEQIRRLMDSVGRVHDAKRKKLLDIGKSRAEQNPPSIFNTDWEEVARVSGGEFTPEQCKYRWNRETHPDKFLSSAAGVWARKETQALERALRDYGLFSGSIIKKLPQNFTIAVKDRYNVERPSRGIKAKAQEILRKHYEKVSLAGNQARLSSLVNMGLPMNDWTTEEDRRLLQATYNTGYTHWDRISRLVFHQQKSAWQCRLRSIQLRSQDDVPGAGEPDPSIIESHRPDLSWIKGQREWTEQEQSHLFDAVEEHGMFGSWDKIQQDLARRSCNVGDGSSVFQIRSVEEVKQEYWRLNTVPHASAPLATSYIDDRPSPSPQSTSESASEGSPRLSHPQMFLAPGIMKIRDKNLRQDLRQEGVIDPDLGQGQFGVVWWPADEKKFAGLIAKYGTSTVSWRLISDKMSIPIKKCQDKLRSMEQARKTRQIRSQVKK
ncbi:hypothetical protein BGZ93_007559 [Podila epicladia]|nr:hypothetical protein BGZ92_005236 [Podila epicladia]KAG0099452.1 hypothetical protein BGZ93_007559 [Podila epicladia]